MSVCAIGREECVCTVDYISDTGTIPPDRMCSLCDHERGSITMTIYPVPIICTRCREGKQKCNVGLKTPCGVYKCRRCQDTHEITVSRRDALFGGAFTDWEEPCPDCKRTA